MFGALVVGTVRSSEQKKKKKRKRKEKTFKGKRVFRRRRDVSI